mgnify:CR=1 FL=1
MPVDASAETRRSRPFGLLHVHCVDVVLDRGCLRTAETLRLQLGYGAQRQSYAGTIEWDGDGTGRTLALVCTTPSSSTSQPSSWMSS